MVLLSKVFSKNFEELLRNEPHIRFLNPFKNDLDGPSKNFNRYLSCFSIVQPLKASFNFRLEIVLQDFDHQLHRNIESEMTTILNLTKQFISFNLIKLLDYQIFNIFDLQTFLSILLFLPSCLFILKILFDHLNKSKFVEIERYLVVK